MDKLKEQLGPVIKHGFWIVTSLVILVGVGVWYMATSSLSEETDTRTAALQGQFDSLAKIRQISSTHANDDSHKEMEAIIENEVEEVYEAWQQQYARQKKVLVWPDLGAEFKKAVAPLHPIEQTVEYPTPPEDEILPALRKRYKLYIEEELPKLAEIVGAEWTAEFSAPATGGYGGYEGAFSGMDEAYGSGGFEEQGYGGYNQMGSGQPQEEPPLVKWASANQQDLIAKMFPWRSKETPSTLEILYSQEDIWVLRNILQTIARVNGSATQHYQATIREIQEVSIGKSAAGTRGELMSSSSGMGGYESMMEGYDDQSENPFAGMSGEEMMGSMMGSSGAGGEPVQAPDPANNRYVDNNYEQIEASTLRSAMESDKPDDVYLNVAKRIPVRLVVKMDQRKISELIAECGSSQLMIEVRQVRINATGKSSGGMGGGGYGPEFDGGGDFGYGGGSGGAARSYGEYPNDVPVEVYGIVYLYNPPDEEKLGLDSVDENTRIEGDETEPSGGSGSSDEPPPAESAPAAPAPGDSPSAPQPDASQPAPNNGQPAPNNGQPAPNNGQPAPGNGQPAPGNAQPADDDVASSATAP